MSGKRKQSIADIEAALGLGGVDVVEENPYRPGEQTETRLKTFEPPGTEKQEVQEKITGKVGDQEASVIDTREVINATQRIADRVFHFGSGVINTSRIKLESLPTPGSILLPLGILLLFFIVLLPVNGHTRLMWLWLVITGNARIGQALIPPTLLQSGIAQEATTRNPNQQGAASLQQPGGSNTSPGQAASKATVTVSNGKRPVLQHKPATQQKIKATSTKTGKGAGPSPFSPGIYDAQSGIAQISYSHLLANRTGYE